MEKPSYSVLSMAGKAGWFYNKELQGKKLHKDALKYII